MKYVPAASNFDRQLFGVLVVPSWLSLGGSLLVGLVVGLGTVLLTDFKSSSLRLEILNTHLSAPTQYQSLTSRVLDNNFISNLPLLLFWTLVGLVVYLFVANMFAAIHNTAELRNEMGYVNADRHELLMTATKHLLVRLVVMIAWLGYILFFFDHIVPYCVAAALAGSGQSSLQSGGYILLSIGLMAAAVQLHIIFLRLLLLRPRVFSSALYVD